MRFCSTVAFNFIMLAAASVLAQSPATLLSQYESYGLPFPPVDAKLSLVIQKTGNYHGKTRYSRELGFVVEQDGNRIQWRAASPRVLSVDTKVTPIEPDVQWLAKSEPALQWEPWRAGFPSFPDLELAIHCQSRGYAEFAKSLLESFRAEQVVDPFGRYSKRSHDHRKALLQLVWNYSCNEFALSTEKRPAIIDRLVQISSSDASFDTPMHLNVIDDMRQTLVPRTTPDDSLESSVESLLTLGSQHNDRGEGFAHIDGEHESHPGYIQLRDAGLDAVPTLIEHIHDFRLTRAVDVRQRAAWNVRIADVVYHLLCGLIDDELPCDLRIESGRGKTADRDYVLNWWRETRDTHALAYLQSNAFAVQNGRLVPRSAVLRSLSKQYPAEFIKLFEANLTQLDDAASLIETLADSNVSEAEKTRLLLTACQNSRIEHRLESIEQLLQREHPRAATLLVHELDAIPVTPDTDSWLCPASRCVRLLRLTDDARVWTSLEVNAKRVGVGQRLQILDEIRSCRGQQDECALAFLRTFLDDPSSRTIRVVQPENDASDGLEGSAAEQRRFAGTSAGFQFIEMSVQDFAALKIAELLEIDVAVDASWSAKDWIELRNRIDLAIAKRESKNPG